METLNKIKTIQDLILLTNSNNIFLEFYKKFKKIAFLQLVKTKSFRRSFYDLLTDNKDNKEILKILLKFYPIGQLFNDSLNELQIDVYNNIENIDYRIVELFFYPTNYIENINIDIPEKYKDILQIHYKSGGGGIASIATKFIPIIKNLATKAYNSESGQQIKQELIKEGTRVATNVINKTGEKINDKLK